MKNKIYTYPPTGDKYLLICLAEPFKAKQDGFKYIGRSKGAGTSKGSFVDVYSFEEKNQTKYAFINVNCPKVGGGDSLLIYQAIKDGKYYHRTAIDFYDRMKKAE